MALARRTLLSALPLLLAGGAHAGAGRLRLEPAGAEMVALTGPAIRRPLLLPAAGAVLLPQLACAGEILTVTRFALEEDGAMLEWAILALAQDGVVALLALEPLSWRGATQDGRGGARMTTRLSATSDRTRVQWLRDVAIRQTPTLWRRESWIDYLAWTPPQGLIDAPVRAPLPGTHQHMVAIWRRRAAALVPPPRAP